MFSNTKGQTNPKDDTKVYGCAVMSMDLYETGLPFRFNKDGKDLRYINFNSEVVVRKGDEGWIINSKVDNYTGQGLTYFDYVLTTYKYKDNKWQPEGDRKWFKDQGTMAGDPVTYSISGSSVTYTIARYDKKLVIKVPKEAPWWNSVNWVAPTSSNSSTISRNKIDEKHWSGIWIDDSSHGEDSWIFENIELYIDEKKYSKVFCKGESNQCFQVFQESQNKLRTSDKLGSNSWKEMLGSNNSYKSTKVSDMLKDTMKGIIDKLGSSRGSWLELEKVCGLKDIRNLDDSQKKHLSMFCTNGKKA